MMAEENITQFYQTLCEEHEIKPNPRVVEALKEATMKQDFNLKLSGNDQQRLDGRDVLVLCKCLINKPVTGLDLRYNNITDEGAEGLVTLLEEENSDLRFLDLMFNNITADGVEALSTSLECNNTLLSLRLAGNKIGNSGAMELASALQVNDSLQELELNDCDLTLESVIAVTVMLKSNSSLRSVDISRPLLFSLQEEWTVHCSQMLVVNSSLVELHLGKMGMTDTGMERLTEGLRLNRSLRYLDLRCNRVTRDGARHLAAVLKTNPTLEVVDLSFNVIEDEGAENLSEALTSPSCSLRELSVCSNSIRKQGLLSLTQALKVNTTLTHIYIWGNYLEEPVCQAFNELLSSGRLQPQQTDVSPYEVDGRMNLAMDVWSLRKRYHGVDGCRSDPEKL